MRIHLAGVVVLALAAPAQSELLVVSTSPPPRHVAAAVHAPIAIRFDRALDPATVSADTIRVFGQWSGPATGAITLSSADRIATLHPDAPFMPGEPVMVVLGGDLAGADGQPLRDGGWSWQFWTAARPGPRSFASRQVLSTNGPGESSRPYGGLATDLDDDGWCDLSIVNEDTFDVRVFMNRGDGTGTFDGFLEPPSDVGVQASPSVPADFDADGVPDIAVVNISTHTVSVLRGRGDGTFDPQRSIPVGTSPRGIAALDADGDADVDLVCTNFASSNLALLLNDGAGGFAAPVFFEGGGAGERALAAADMDEDGRLDLVVSLYSSGTVAVLRNEGDGTFTPQSPQSAGGGVWMLVTGDVDGDGHEDVAGVASAANVGTLLRGNGDGTLAAATTVAADPFPLATDLGDLDGDGDLDWVISSFNGDFFLYVNDGAGTFTFDQELPAPVAASCSLLADLDGDRDLDLVLVDEIADELEICGNGDVAPLADVTVDGAVDVADLVAVIVAWGTPDPAADVDGDGLVGVADLVAVVLAWDS